jgi:hypothetical protein
LDCLHYFPHLTYSQCWMAELSANFWPQGFVRVSFKQSENSHLILRNSTFVSIPHPVAPPPSSNGWYSVLATDVIAIPPSAPETVYSVKVFNLVLHINKQTDNSTLLDIQTRLSDKKKCEFSDCLNDTLTNPCGQKFADVKLVKNTIF